MAMCLLAGCNSNKLRPPKPDPIPTPKVVDQARLNHIYDLLDAAYLAIQDNRLTTPVDDNAFFRYARVLSLDPQNMEALDGLTAIADRYLQWAIDASSLGQFRKASAYLAKAAAVDADHANINAVTKRIKTEAAQDSALYQLDTTEIGAQSYAARSALKAIATKIESRRARVLITARTDAEGRWIYQQLNEFTALRVRASFELGPQPMILLKSRRK